ncbi:MAG: RecQ family ATP-dependent DNA helicase [Deltaproteobacteria bacterium]|nr:RecQ family ATP-dependent DNA helicase [Deltaproteobacteria bacterium]
MPNEPTDGESPDSGQEGAASTGTRRRTRKKAASVTASKGTATKKTAAKPKATRKAATQKTAKKATRKASTKKAARKTADPDVEVLEADAAEGERPKRRPAARKRAAAKKPAPPLEPEEFSVAEEMFDLDDDFEPEPRPRTKTRSRSTTRSRSRAEPRPREDAPVESDGDAPRESDRDAPAVTKIEAVESIEDALEELQAEALAMGDDLDEDDEDLEPEEELEIPTGPVFEGEVPLETREQRLAAMRKAALRLGIRRLHPEQEEVIEQGLGGKDVMMILPTGFGKSACYQIPSMILSKPVVVISPLLALMQDQYDKMQKLGVPCVRLDGTIRGGKRKEALERIKSGERLLVMTTPETLGSPDASEALIASGVSLAAVDEAHCISEWGYDFRPAYLQIGERLRAMGAPPVVALTATATEKVRMAIVRFVGMRDPHVVATSPHRSNLAFDVLHCAGGARLRALARLALRVRRPGIIYCSTTREVDEIWAVLKRFGVPVHRYHGKMTQADRKKNQNSFMQRGRRTVMIATNAFGLGIDKPDIRYVLHYQSPASLEQYVQEAGRAGRDGRRANCILLFSSEDRAIHESLLARSRVRPEQLYKLARALTAWALEEKTPSLQALALSAELGSRTTGALLALMEEATLVKWDQDAVYVIVPPEEFEPKARELAGQFETLRTQDARRLDAVADYAIDAECRATFLREYFGEEGEEPCGMCDRCRGQADRPDSFWEPLAPPKGEERRRRGRSGGRPNSKSGGRRRGQKQNRGRRRPASASGKPKQKAASNTARRRSEANGDARAAADGDARGSRKRRRRGSRGRRRRGRGQRGPESGDQGDPPPSAPPSN